MFQFTSRRSRAAGLLLPLSLVLTACGGLRRRGSESSSSAAAEVGVLGHGHR